VARSKLDLDDCPRTKVFRQVDAILRADPTLRRVFGAEGGRRFLSWEGDPVRDAKPLDDKSAPAIRITPAAMGEDGWYSPEAQMGDLAIEVEILLRGTNVDDLMNVWWAVQRAIYPKSGAQDNANALRDAGSFTGMVAFVDPAFDRAMAEKSGYIDAVGRMKVDVLETLNP
jgi:hypothetical protein